jgi:WD40 repeat protein
MNVVVGDNSGLLKVVSLKTNGGIKKLGSQNRERGAVDAISWAGLYNPEQEVAVGLRCGSVEVWNTMTGELAAEVPSVQLNKNVRGDKIIGLEVIRTASSSVLDSRGGPEASRVIVAATKAGRATITPWFDAETASQIKMQRAERQQQILEANKGRAYAERKAAFDEFNAPTDMNLGVAWTAGANLARMRVSRSLDVMATGGNESNLSLWDLTTQQRVFKAKNLANDWLNLRVPNHDLDYAFLPAVDSGVWAPGAWANESTDSYRIAAVTGYKKVRLYDLKADARPVMDVELGKYSAHSVAAMRDGVHVIVGDGVGRVQILDTRFNLRPVGILRGASGSTRSVSVHNSLPMVASVGLDRHLRVHDLTTRHLLKAVYLKQKLNCCLFSSVEPARGKARSDVADKDVAYDRRGNAIRARRGVAADPEDGAAAAEEEGGDVWRQFDAAATANASTKASGKTTAVSDDDDGEDEEEDEEEGDDEALNFELEADEDDEEDEEIEYEMEEETVAPAKSKHSSSTKSSSSSSSKLIAAKPAAAAPSKSVGSKRTGDASKASGVKKARR